MAYGRLAAVDLSAATNNLVYTASAETFATLNVCSRSGTCTVRVAIADNGTPAAEDWIEYDVALTAGGVPLVREGLYLQSTDRIYVYTDSANAAAVVWGKTA